MMNVSPEELRRLQILNDYVAQSIEAAQRLNPYLQQQRGPWQSSYMQGATPWGAMPAMGGYGTVPYGISLSRGMYPTPFGAGIHGAPIPGFGVPGAGFPMHSVSPYGVTPWGIPAGLFHSGPSSMADAQQNLWANWQNAANGGNSAAIANNPAALAALRGAYGATGISPFATGYGATGLSPLASGYSATGLSPFASGYSATGLSPLASGYSATGLSPLASGYGTSFGSGYGAMGLSPLASGYGTSFGSGYGAGLQHTGIDPTTAAMASAYGATGIDPFTAAAFGGAGAVHSIADAIARTDAHRRALQSSGLLY